MKECLSLLLSLCLLLAPLSLAASASVGDRLRFTVNTLDGGTVTQDDYQDKLLLLVFVKTQMYPDGTPVCGLSMRCAQALADIYWLNDPGVEVLLLDANNYGEEPTRQFAEYCDPEGHLTFCWGRGANWLLADAYRDARSFGICALVRDGVVADTFDNVRDGETITSHLAPYFTDGLRRTHVADLGRGYYNGSINAKLDNESGTIRALFAFYNGGRLVYTHEEQVTAAGEQWLSLWLPDGLTYTEAKLFLLDGASAPLCPAARSAPDHWAVPQ